MSVLPSIFWLPYLPWEAILAAALIFCGLFVFSLRLSRASWPSSFLRLSGAAVILLMLANPQLHSEIRKPVSDIALVLIDQSSSQQARKRQRQIREAAAYIDSQAQSTENLELRVQTASSAGVAETRLFEDIEKSLADVPQNRRAGVLLVTDGQVHDVPLVSKENAARFGPINAWLTGEKNEKDRKIEILSAPVYGIVGKPVTLRYQISDTKNIPRRPASVSIKAPDLPDETKTAPSGVPQSLTFTPAHEGANYIEISTPVLTDEISPLNNRVLVSVSGVRERLKVLLVSGEPSAGGRMWRDLLKSDPGIDLVHFTILRDPQKFDLTPQNDMALIAFPIQELFRDKLNDFDLIVFDHYRDNHILPTEYFENIANYVKAGGAFLEAGGPNDGKTASLAQTPLADILPSTDRGQRLTGAFRPDLTERGLQHPVTGVFKSASQNWGRWLGQNDAVSNSENILMRGLGNRPLLILERKGKGRVAQILSDQIWLWARGYDGGGPSADLLGRIVHWLTKEPELDERALKFTIAQDKINIAGQAQSGRHVLASTPSGKEMLLDLAAETVMDAPEDGLYSFKREDGAVQYLVKSAAGTPEQSDLLSTAGRLAPLVKASGGAIIRFEDQEKPGFTSQAFATGRFHIRRNNAYDVLSAQDMPVMPQVAWLALSALCLILGWALEGRKLSQSPRGRREKDKTRSINKRA